jgi:hypothetical protein
LVVLDVVLTAIARSEIELVAELANMTVAMKAAKKRWYKNFISTGLSEGS